MSKETLQFETEVRQILDLMINSLYSQREVFLRELISNASDALDNLRFSEITDKDLVTDDLEKHIRLIPDTAQKTLTIVDNGIGMSREEIVQNIGTIAYSGSKRFVEKMRELKENPELIGQFGVGFYSSFMVANKVRVHSAKAGSSEGTIWESSGDGKFTIESQPRPEGRGTTITLFLKSDTDENDSDQDFSDGWTLKSLVKKYSDFISYPIKMKMEHEEPELDADGKPIDGKSKTVERDETLNSQQALWLKSPKEVKKEEYNEFYKHLTGDWLPPVETIHYKAEGNQEFTALLYIPTNQPFDYHHRNTSFGLDLYVKRVFVAASCEHLLPSYLRFVKGMVDSSDIPLNISREMIQKDQNVKLIERAIVSKLLRSLKGFMERDRDAYETFWKQFGATLKEGIASEFNHKDQLTDLALFYSSNSDGLTSLKEVKGRMAPDQPAIYYMSGESLKNLKDSPHLEKLRQKGYEVLYLVDPVDEWVTGQLTEFDGKKLVSAVREDLELGGQSKEEESESSVKSKEEELKPVTDAMKKALEETVKEVKISNRLVDSPVCLVTGASDPTAHMERMMEALGKGGPKTKRILEINPKHPIFSKMLCLDSVNREKWAQILYNQALLNEGSPLENPAQFTKQISELMLEQS